jgi:hypothetical protein
LSLLFRVRTTCAAGAVEFPDRQAVEVRVGHGLKFLDLGETQPTFQAAVRALGGLALRQMLQNLARRPALHDAADKLAKYLNGKTGNGQK